MYFSSILKTAVTNSLTMTRLSPVWTVPPSCSSHSESRSVLFFLLRLLLLPLGSPILGGEMLLGGERVAARHRSPRRSFASRRHLDVNGLGGPEGSGRDTRHSRQQARQLHQLSQRPGISNWRILRSLHGCRQSSRVEQSSSLDSATDPCEVDGGIATHFPTPSGVRSVGEPEFGVDEFSRRHRRGRLQLRGL